MVERTATNLRCVDGMLDAGVPTARATRHADAASAKRAAAALGPPVVVKASGLAAGKGVVVAGTLASLAVATAFSMIIL